jgi:hypothetical protein
MYSPWEFVTDVFKPNKAKNDKKRKEDIENAAELCVPVIAMEWELTKEDCLVDEKEALLSNSVLVCAKGGTISIVDDGQNS